MKLTGMRDVRILRHAFSRCPAPGQAVSRRLDLKTSRDL
jgi:hypothetical protein